MTRALCILLSCAALACSTEKARSRDVVQPPPPPTPAAEVETLQATIVRDPKPSKHDLQALAAGNGAFAFDLFRKLARSDARQNIVFSPYSVSLALAMTYDGAREATRDELAAAMHFALPAPRLYEAFNASQLQLASRGQGKKGAQGTPFKLNLDNAFWLQRGVTVQPAFLDLLARHFGASVRLTNFEGAPEGARKAINLAVERSTASLIPELLKQGDVSPSTRFVLTNTVYLDAGWKHTFSERATYDAIFNKADGKPVPVNMMREELYVPYAQGESYRAVALPYADDALRFVAVLPNPGKLAEVERALSPSWLKALDQQLHETPISVHIPRLEVRQRTSLATQLGAPTAFGSSANFTGIAEGVQLSDVIHEAVLKLMEGGTVAAASTAVIAIAEGGVHQHEHIAFNRPFLFAIVDRPTGAILFLGRVADPTH